MSKTWTQKQRDVALKKARSYARGGNAYYAQYFARRAASFDYVSDRQFKNVEMLLTANIKATARLKSKGLI